jgi:regulatory protein
MITRKLQTRDRISKREAFQALRRSLEQRDDQIRVPVPVEGYPDIDSDPVEAGGDHRACAESEIEAEAAHRLYQAAYERAVRYLAAREHSERELLSKLRAREVDGDLARRVLLDLQSRNLQSDERFAESFVRSRVNRGQGPIRIRQELVRRGIGDDLLEEVLTRSGEFWIGIAAEAREKRFGDALPEERGDWNRQARFLAARGFPADLIYRVLGNLA